MRNADEPQEVRAITETIWDLIEISGCEALVAKPVELASHLQRFLTVVRMQLAVGQYVLLSLVIQHVQLCIYGFVSVFYAPRIYDAVGHFTVWVHQKGCKQWT